MAIHDHLEALAVGVRSGTVPLERFVITKGLNKNPRDYPDCKGHAHLQVSDVVVVVVVIVTSTVLDFIHFCFLNPCFLSHSASPFFHFSPPHLT